MIRSRRVVTRTAVVSLGAALVGAAMVMNTLLPKARATSVVTHAVPSYPMVATPASWMGEVTEGSVSKLASAKGALAAATTTNLNFPASHLLAKLLVKVGDRVKKGQLLAVEGTIGASNALMQTLQTLAAQRANLALIVNDVTVPGDLRILQQAGRVAEDARHNIELGVKADQDALDRARGVLRMDQQTLDAALKKAVADGCGPNGPLAALPTAAETTLCASDDAAIKADQTAVYTQQTTVIADEDKLRTDRGTLETTYAQDLVTVRTDENAYDIARTNRPSQIALQQAVLLADQAAVVGNDGLVNCFVYAPADGVVTAVTGVPGEFMQGAGTQSPPSPLAPGSLAQIPDVGRAATSDIKNPGTLQGIDPLQALRATAPGGGAFIQLSDLNSYQVVVPIPEADAVHIQPGSSVRLTFDALPGVEHNGQVTAVSPAAVDIDGVTNYYASVLVTDADAALKPGLTTTVSIVTDTVKNQALVVPTPAVSTQDGKSFVETPGPDGKPQRVQFAPGKVGDDNTEVVSGLTKGQKVILPPSGPLPQPRPHPVAPRPEAVRPR
jgi:HlyD family secretion protein